MEKLNIVILDAATLGSDIKFSCFEEIGTVTVFGRTEPGQVKENIKDADVVIVNKVKLNRENLCYARNLKLICVTATGYDNIDTSYCRENNIGVCNVKGYSSQSVAQVTIALALSLLNNITHFDRFVKSGEYTKSGRENKVEPVFHELNTLTWGVIGLGNIGKKTADMAKALGFSVLAYKRSPDSDYKCVELSQLLEKSDVISVHLPLTDSTRKIIGKDEIEKMKPGAVFINVARGAVSDEEALADAVLENRLGGLGIDVYDGEPMSSCSPYNKLKDFDNVILTPHMAWGAYESRVRCMTEIVENIKSFLNGERRNRVE